MATVRDEIDEAVSSLALSPEQFAAVPDIEASLLFDSFLGHFTGGLVCRWWWEHFTHATSEMRFVDGRGWERILAIVPDREEKVWFVPEDDQSPYYPVYDVTVDGAQRVIGERYNYEYYLIAKNLRWLLCENHHDWVIAIGDEIRERLEQLRIAGD